MPTVHLLDYVAGNIRSLANAIEKLGFEIEWIKSPADVANAGQLILPGVGHFGHCLSRLSAAGYVEPIRAHILAGKPFMGICVGLQALFESSAESADARGLGIIPGRLEKLDNTHKSVPHIGWNSACVARDVYDRKGCLYGLQNESKYYYVHSYAMHCDAEVASMKGWYIAHATYAEETFVGAIAKDSILGTQFHPEKSGSAGLRVLKAFLDGRQWTGRLSFEHRSLPGLTRRVIACLDVRANDDGDLVVTKGDQYDVREKIDGSSKQQIRNLGKPIDLARRYYEEGADEITFLNITSFRHCPIMDLPMLEILRRTAENVFVPLTIGGGIRDTQDTDGTVVPALEVATLYFKSGADKVSVGSDAVMIAEEYLKNAGQATGRSAIETISAAYGRQAVIVSIDPKRIYVHSAQDTPHQTIKTRYPGPQGEQFCWYQCTSKGGREAHDLDIQQLMTAVESLGAGEILLNCIDRDGSNAGFDLELIQLAKSIVKIPVIASSGAGKPSHFQQVFQDTQTDAALGAGMFHRGEYSVGDVKQYLAQKQFLVRLPEPLVTDL